MPPQIIVELVGDPPSGAGVPLIFPFSKIATAPPQVKLKLASIIGVSSVLWSIVDQDENAVAVLSDPAALEPTFDPTTAVSGTYLIQVLVNGNQVAQSGIAFTTKNLAIRKPAASEKTLFDAVDGWKTALNRAFDSVDAVHDSAAEEDWKNSVRLRVDGDALAAYTRIGNVITADVNGLLPNQDGRAPADGDSILLDFMAPDVDTGAYTINTIGSAGTKFQFTRRTDFDEDTDVTEGIRIPIADGDAFGGMVAKLVTIGAITINTTAIDFILEESGGASIANADFATFDPLPAVTANGSGVGKTLTADVAGPLSMDGASPTVGQSVALGGQANPNDNGVYDVTVAGNGGSFVLTRRPGSDALLSAGYEINITSGTEFTNTSWRAIGGSAVDPDVTAWTWEPANLTWRVVGNTIAADQDDYGPPGWKVAALLQVDGGAADRIITGLDASLGALLYRSSGFGYPSTINARVTIMNFGTTNNLILPHNDNGANSLVTNEFRFGSGVDHILAPGDTVDLMYDGINDHWRPV